jgi:hypothetical protein
MTSPTTACIDSSRLSATNASGLRSSLFPNEFRAYQFDWSQGMITFQSQPLMIKAAHMKLSRSRMPFVRVYFREPGRAFDAHDKAFDAWSG